MVSEFEEAAEVAHDLIKEELQKEGKDEKLLWIGLVSLSTMVMALLSALGALLAAVAANELMIERTKEILEISHLETDRINIELLKSKHAILTSLGEVPDSSEIERIRKYQDDNKKLKIDAEAEESIFQKAISEHELFAIGVTLLSIAIALSGMSLVAKRKMLWAVGLVFGVIGVSFVGVGVCKMIS